MCKAFSCIITKRKKVYWKAGIDNHHELIEKFKIKGDDIVVSTNEELRHKMKFAKVEITPKNDDYLNPDVWVFEIDEIIKPIWWTDEHKEKCREWLIIGHNAN